jgi:trafficking protein particle complex subunit 5
MLELLSWREKTVRRKPEVLDVLRFIHSNAWPYLFGKAADDLQQANAVSCEATDHWRV